MAILEWDKTSERMFETGTKKGVLYVYDASKTGAGEHVYSPGVAWNGLTGVTESPSGAEATSLYADDIKYLNLYSAEELGATINAYMYPDEFAICDGSAGVVVLAPAFSATSTYAVGDEVSYNGANYRCKTAIETAAAWDASKWTLLPNVTPIMIGQQERKTFGLCYRTAIGNDTDGQDHGYKLHLLYGCKASPSERSYETINDSPSAITFSWTITTTPVNCVVNGVTYKPTALITVDSTKCTAAGLAALEAALYGTQSNDAYLPLPGEVYTLLATTGNG
ncbi:MAG: hypothetical protein IJ880_13675 [Bacilli bacterium]|nr:hypothetical protein [Bacilli bacterium]